jgi:hypothetical protein
MRYIDTPEIKFAKLKKLLSTDRYIFFQNTIEDESVSSVRILLGDSVTEVFIQKCIWRKS